MKKKKVLTIAISAGVLVILGAALIFALLQGQNQSYSALLDEGERYISAGNYDKAVIVLKQAIAAEPGEADGYISLSRAYIGMNQTSLAVVTLHDGYEITKSLTIRRALLDLDPEYFAQLDNGDTTEGEGTEAAEKPAQPVLNAELLSFISTACYDDYRQKYGTVTCTAKDGIYVARPEGAAFSLHYYNTGSQRVIDASAGAPYKDYSPNEVVLDDITVLFGGVASITYEQLRTIQAIADLQQEETSLSFKACGCSLTVQCDENGTISRGAEHIIVPTGAEEEIAAYTLSGWVVDAASGAHISGAKLKLYAGYSTTGNAVETTTDSGGKYTVELENSGTYTVVITKSGYIEEKTTVYVSSGSSSSMQSFTISTTLEGDQIRLVLTWGASPTDLDSYLVGTTDDGTSVNVNYMHKKSKDSSENVIADLDVDDLDGYGPETITISNLNGAYTFYVKDYTLSGTMASSGAQVKIYKGNSLVEVVDVCDGVDDSWDVCTIDHGTITVTNRPRG